MIGTGTVGLEPESRAAIYRAAREVLTGAQALVRAAGGRFAITSTRGAGTTVTLWVPTALPN